MKNDWNQMKYVINTLHSSLKSLKTDDKFFIYLENNMKVTNWINVVDCSENEHIYRWITSLEWIYQVYWKNLKF